MTEKEPVYKIYTETRAQYMIIKDDIRFFRFEFPVDATLEENRMALEELLKAIEKVKEEQKQKAQEYMATPKTEAAVEPIVE